MRLFFQKRDSKTYLQFFAAWQPLVCSLMLFSGCRLLNERTVVPEDVANCRKLSQRGMGALQHGDLAAAETLLQRAVQSNPEDAQAHHYHSEALWKAGQFTAALEESKLAYKYAPDDAALATSLAEQYFALGQIQNAAKFADEAIDLYPTNGKAWALRAKTHRVQGELEAALNDYHHALTADPNNQQLLYETAEVYRMLNRPQRALAILGTLRETYVIGDEPPQLFALEGAAYVGMNRLPEAIQSLTIVTLRAPTAEAWAALALAQQKAGLWENAHQSLVQAEAIDPKFPGLQQQQQQLQIVRNSLINASEKIQR
jgi:tetratricopeptide (TPR) repeat protein